MNGPLHDAIVSKIIRPALAAISHDAEGIIVGVDYYHQLVDIEWKDANTNGVMYADNVTIPQDGNGIYRQSVKIGDRIKIGFRQGNHSLPYVSTIYKSNASKSDYYSKAGPSIPRGISY
jgi:hypothetical protein